MPPEPLPWERKNYSFKDYRKHDALGGSGGTSSFTPRWRESYHGPRVFPRASPRRPPPGHYRQGGFYHPAYSEDPGGYGCTPSRADRFWPEDDSFRSYSGRYGAGRSVGSRDSRGSFRRSPFWDSGDFSRQHHEPHVTGPRSVAVPISSATQPPFKDQNDKIGGGIDDGLATGHRFYHRDRSSWKQSLKWSRAVSSSSAKADRTASEDAGSDAATPPGKGNPVGSPVMSPQPSVDDPPKKKPRLGWGQGLAKYEKQKVEGTSDFSEGAVIRAFSDTSFNISGPPVCVSPATPWAACSSSLEIKPGIQSLSCDDDKCLKHNISGGLPDDIPIKLEHLGTNPTTALTSVISDLLQPDDVFSADLTFTRYSSLNKLLMLKEDISKELEKTECKIDLLDNELKTLSCDHGNHHSIVIKSTNSMSKLCEDQCNEVNDSSNLVASNIESTNCIDSMMDFNLCDNSSKQSDRQVLNMTKVEPLALSSGAIQSTSSVSDAFNKCLDECTISFNVEMPRVTEVQQISLADVEEGPLAAGEIEKVISSEGNNNSPSEILDTSTNTVSDLIISATTANKGALVATMNTMQAGTSQSDIWESVNFKLCKENALKIREKLVFHKRLVKFKEQILALKFRALHHLWKEDLRLLSLRKHRFKSNKRLEMGGRTLQNVYQKQRSSIKTHFVLPGNSKIIPTAEILNLATTLLSDSLTMIYRGNLKMPALMLDEERLHTRFVTHNAFIEDPLSFEKEKSMINPWSQEEKEVIMEMLVKYGKNFTKIASYLQHKTTADCIEFYYKNHKSEMFKEVKERLDLRKQQQRLPANTYLVTSGKKWNPEANAASVDLIGASSVVASQNHISPRSRQKYPGKTVYGTYHDWEVSHGPYNCSDSINSIEDLSHKRESFGICGALSSEAVSSCVTNSADPAGKVCNMMVNPTCNAEISQRIDEDDTCSDEGFMMLQSTDWSDEEKSIFIQALRTYGKDFTRISSCLKSRSREQCKVFYSKARKCLGLDLINHGAKCNIPLVEKHGRSDTEDACGTEIDSAVGSLQPCSKLDEGISHAIISTSTVEVSHGVNTLAQSEADGASKQELVQEIKLKEIENKIDSEQVTIHHNDKSVGEQNSSQYNISSKGKVNDILVCDDNKGDHVAAVYVDEEIKVECSYVETLEVESKQGSSVAQTNIDHNDPVFDVKVEVDSEPLSVAQNELINKQQPVNCFSQISGRFQGFACDPNMNNESAVLQRNEADQCSQITLVPNYQCQTQLDMLHCVPKNTQGFSLKQDSSHSMPLNPLLPDPSSICFATELNVSPQSSLNFEEHMSVRHQNVVYQCNMDRSPVVSQVNGQVHVLGGSQLQILSQKIQREADKVSKKPVLLETYSRRNGGSHSNLSFLSDVGGNKSGIFRVLSSKSGKLCPSKSESSQSDNNNKALSH